MSTSAFVPGPVTTQVGGGGVPWLSSVAVTHVTSAGPSTVVFPGWLPPASALAVIVFGAAETLWLHADKMTSEMIATAQIAFDMMLIIPPLLEIDRLFD
jgi:hypothetical protein